MKKNGLFKGLMITFLVVFVLTWLVPYGYYSGGFTEYELYRLGFFDFCQYLLLPFFQSMFIQVLMFILAVGLLYGVLSKTGTYRNVIEKIAKKIKKRKELFLVLAAFAFAALSSFGGYGLLLFIFIPAVIAIILELGYDKFTAFLVTFGAMLIGVIGATFANAYLETVWTALGTTWSNQIWFKVSMFVVSFALLVLFTLLYLKSKKAKKSSKKTTKKNAKEEVKDEKVEDLFLGESKDKKAASWPIYVVFGILFVLLILGCTSWANVFGVTAFENLHSTITSFQIGDYTIFSYILGSVAALGTWSYFEMTIMCVIASLIIAKSSKLKSSEIKDGMVYGLKTLLVPALLVTFSYGVLIIIANSGVFTTLMSYLIEGTSKFTFKNAFFTSLITVVGSVLHVDLTYVGNFFLPYLAGTYTSAKAVASLNVLTQGLYGVTMFVAPTSLFLLLGLSYLGISYKNWFKFIWKLVLALLAVVVITMIIVALV